MDLTPWQRRLWTAMWLGSLSFSLGHALAGWAYDRLRRR